MFGEAVTWNTVLGSALIIGGVVAVMRGKRKQT
jgi:drug/metabolite transporter (DMT)-like permease